MWTDVEITTPSTFPFALTRLHACSRHYWVVAIKGHIHGTDTGLRLQRIINCSHISHHCVNVWNQSKEFFVWKSVLFCISLVQQLWIMPWMVGSAHSLLQDIKMFCNSFNCLLIPTFTKFPLLSCQIINYYFIFMVMVFPHLVRYNHFILISILWIIKTSCIE